jgi:hypothetical protein
MRPSHEASVPEFPLTPIYDAMYAEYSRLFRTLPGDRTGEEDLHFKGFGLDTVHGTGSFSSDEWPRAVLPHRTRTPAALPPGRRDRRTY